MGAVAGSGPAELSRLMAGLRELANARYLQKMSRSLGAESIALVKEGFDLGQDPYGQPWASVRRGGLPLRKTGRLRNAFAYTGTDSQVRLENGLIYANMMNFGTAGLPGGKLTPKGKKALSFDAPGVKKKRGTSWQPTVTVKSVVIPGRKMMPDEGDLPAHWEERLRATAEKVMEAILKSKG